MGSIVKTIKKHFKYCRYLLTHKFWVLYYCFKHGEYWLGIIHDWDKFIPWKWRAYANHFCGDNPPVPPKTGNLQTPQTAGRNPEFAAAWESHYKIQPHHPQYWRHCNGRDPDDMPLETPVKYIIEMIADWHAAGLAQGKGHDIKPWYLENKDKLILHPETKRLVDFLVLRGVLDYYRFNGDALFISCKCNCCGDPE